MNKLNKMIRMKRIGWLCALLLAALCVQAQDNLYINKVEEFAKMRPVDSTDVVMLGDEFTEYAGDWNVLLRYRHVRNRGIAGDNVAGLTQRLHQITQGKPKMIFLMVGARDLLNGTDPSALLSRYATLINDIRKASPSTKLYVQSVLPVNESYGREDLKGKTNVVAQFNRSLRHYCERHHVAYINVFRAFVRRGTNELRRELTQDGFALSAFGYKVWAFELRKYLVE